MAADQLIRTYHKLLSLLAAATTYDGYLSSVERYDPATNAWQAVAPMATARAPLLRENSRSVRKNCRVIWSRPIFFFRRSPSGSE